MKENLQPVVGARRRVEDSSQAPQPRSTNGSFDANLTFDFKPDLPMEILFDTICVQLQIMDFEPDLAMAITYIIGCVKSF